MDCGCGTSECLNLACGYPFCTGCEEHHRPPVAEPGFPCPVDVDALRRDLADLGGEVFYGGGWPDGAVDTEWS